MVDDGSRDDTYRVVSESFRALWSPFRLGDRRCVRAISLMPLSAFYARNIGIKTGKGFRPLDVNVFESGAAFPKSFRANPGFDPRMGVPKLKEPQ